MLVRRNACNGEIVPSAHEREERRRPHRVCDRSIGIAPQPAACGQMGRVVAGRVPDPDKRRIERPICSARRPFHTCSLKELQ